MNTTPKFNFFIDVTVDGIFDLAMLTIALQAGYDAGAAGSFEVREAGDNTVVRFERTVADDDAGYLRHLVDRYSLSPMRAAQLQLARELVDGVGRYAQPFVTMLLAFDGVVADPHQALDLVMATEV